MPQHRPSTSSHKHAHAVHPSAHGGVLRNRRAGRGKRRISTRFSMHLVLRSSVAKGAWSFVRPQNRAMIQRVLAKHSARLNVVLHGVGNAGNHLHLRAQFISRKSYLDFIRAIAGEIALHIKKISHPDADRSCRSLWDHRPFSSIVSGLKYVNRLTDYIKLNQLEGRGFPRAFARLVVQRWREGTVPEFEGGVLII